MIALVILFLITLIAVKLTLDARTGKEIMFWMFMWIVAFYLNFKYLLLPYMESL